MTKELDLIIIGGGAGAFAAAIRANALGKKTVLINDGLPLGGTCVNVGCVPSKALVHAAKVVHDARHRQVRGIEVSINTVDFAEVVAREIGLVETLRQEKYASVLDDLEYVEFVQGRAEFTSPTDVAVGDQMFRAQAVVIATGSTATIPDIDGLEDAGYLTHVEAVSLETVPTRLAVIGAGPVGLEFAQVYSRFGSNVTILQRGDSIAPQADPMLAHRLGEILRKEGLTIHTGAHVSSVTGTSTGKRIAFTSGDGVQSIEVDEILIAAGKDANSGSLNLAAAGVDVDDRGRVVTTPTLQTSQPGIFAVGDVTDLPVRLETTAGKEGTYAVDNAFTGSTRSINYDEVPSAIFTDPQLATVGYTEERQMEEMNACACRTVTFDKLPKALITNETEGAARIAIHPETQRLQGMHILAPHAADLIAQAMTLIHFGATIDEIEELLPVFPTQSEAIKLAAMSFKHDISRMSCCI